MDRSRGEHRPRFTAGDLAGRFGLEVRGDPTTVVCGVATIGDAAPDRLTFLSNPKYRAALSASRAGIIVVSAADAEAATGTVLVARDPYATYARIAALFEPATDSAPGIHPTAVVAASAQVDPSASIAALAYVGARSVVGAGASIGPGSVVGDDCVVGAGSRLVARVTLVTRVRLGQRVLVHPGAVIGADGFGIAMDQGAWLKVPQLGGVVIGDDCEIGANTTIDRGAIDDTVLEEDVRLDNQIQLGHNVRIGAHTAMAGCVAVAGSARIGRYCLIGGGAGVVGHIEICDRVVVTAMSLVTRSIRVPGEYSSGTPLMDNRAWRKAAARFRQLDRLFRSGPD